MNRIEELNLISVVSEENEFKVSLVNKVITFIEKTRTEIVILKHHNFKNYVIVKDGIFKLNFH